MKELAVIFFCTWKFAATFPVAICILKMSPFEVLLYTNTGGIIGSVIFLKLSHLLIRWYNGHRASYPDALRKKRKIFTRANRKFVKIKINYGLPGIVILSPVVLSIPVGSFLAAKYYGSKTSVVAWMIAGQVLWSLVYTLIYTQLSDFTGMIADQAMIF